MPPPVPVATPASSAAPRARSASSRASRSRSRSGSHRDGGAALEQHPLPGAALAEPHHLAALDRDLARPEPGEAHPLRPRRRPHGAVVPPGRQAARPPAPRPRPPPASGRPARRPGPTATSPAGIVTSTHTAAPGSTSTADPPLRRCTTSAPRRRTRSQSTASSFCDDPSTSVGRVTSNTTMLRSPSGRATARSPIPSRSASTRQPVPVATGQSWQVAPAPRPPGRAQVFRPDRLGKEPPMISVSHHPGPTLARRLDAALLGDGRALDALATADPVDDHDALVSLLAVHDLHVAPLDGLDARVRWQHHPAVASLQVAAGGMAPRAGSTTGTAAAAWELPDGGVGGAYGRSARPTSSRPSTGSLAEDATFDQLARLPHARGRPRRRLRRPGRRLPDRHRRRAEARTGPQLLGRDGQRRAGRGPYRAAPSPGPGARPRPAARTDQPMEALERSALGRFWPEPLAPAGDGRRPRAHRAAGRAPLPQGRRRPAAVDAPADALPFYEVHAAADPRHGKDWLDHVVTPLSGDGDWAAAMVRGARWRSAGQRRLLPGNGRPAGAGDGDRRAPGVVTRR